MKQLLIIAPSFLPSKGGVESHLKHLVPLLHKKGYKITVLCRHSNQIPRLQYFDGAPVLRLPRTSLGIKVWTKRHRKLLSKIDIVHTHDFFPIPIYRAIHNQVNWVHTFHGYEGYPLNASAIKSRQEVRKMVRRCIGVGKFIEKWYGTKCDDWIYGAISPKDIPQKLPPKWDIIFYGRLEEDTGIRTYVEAFDAISRKNRNLSMVIVGSGSLESEIKSYASERKLNIEFFEASDEVLNIVSQAKIAFVSGYLAILESAVIGLNVISVYDTPIKKDYLKMHPMSDTFSICCNAKEVVDAYTSIKNVSISPVLRDWAISQTWGEVAELYSRYYEQNN